MQTKIIILFIFLFLTFVSATTYVAVSYSSPQIISPLPDKTYTNTLSIEPTSILSPSLSPTPIPTIAPTPKPTPTPAPAAIFAPSGLEPLFIKYSDDYSIDNQLLKRIAKCESGFNPNASANGYAGLFQFSQALWTQTRNLLGLNSDQNLRFNAEESIRTAAFMVSQNHLGIWPNCNK